MKLIFCFFCCCWWVSARFVVVVLHLKNQILHRVMSNSHASIIYSITWKLAAAEVILQLTVECFYLMRSSANDKYSMSSSQNDSLLYSRNAQFCPMIKGFQFENNRLAASRPCQNMKLTHLSVNQIFSVNCMFGMGIVKIIFGKSSNPDLSNDHRMVVVSTSIYVCTRSFVDTSRKQWDHSISIDFHIWQVTALDESSLSSLCCFSLSNLL